MSFREDKIKVLEMICSKTAPADITHEIQNVTLGEEDFKLAEISLNGSFLILKDMFEHDFIKSLQTTESEIIMEIDARIDFYTKLFKYPETEYEDFIENFYDSALITSSKISITLDPRKGIYRSDNPESNYPIKSDSKRALIISHLCHNDKASILELEKETKQPNTLTMKEIKQINLNFRKKLNVAYDLIIKIPTGGYSLDKDRFEIKTLL